MRGVFEITHSCPWAANSLVVEMADGTILMVDTPYTPQATSQLLDWIHTQFGERDIIAINCHFHLDNLGGNQVLIAAGIPVYGSDLTVSLLEERGEKNLQETIDYMEREGNQERAAKYQVIELMPPTDIFHLGDGLTLTFSEEQVQIIFPGAGHSPDNIVVYFPDRKLLFGGCLVIGWDAIGNRNGMPIHRSGCWKKIRTGQATTACSIGMKIGKPSSRVMLIPI